MVLPCAVRPFTQLFVDGKMMTTARWPNADRDPDKIFEMQRASTTGGDRTSISDPNLPAGDWAGGKICALTG